MSRIGARPVEVPDGVEVKLERQAVSVRGPKGSLSQKIPPGISVTREERRIVVRRSDDQKKSRALHGLTRALVANMVQGVSTGFAKVLEVHGVGYNVKLQDGKLVLELGYSNPVQFPLPEGVEVEVQTASNPAVFTVTGYDKQKVGQVAADLRRLRPAEPYKGKGIRYQGEQIRRKAGKTFASAQ